MNAPDIQILRVKDRLKHTNDSGWADCSINFVFMNDRTLHACKVQLVAREKGHGCTRVLLILSQRSRAVGGAIDNTGT
jgi:hypothetical protein